MKAREIIDDCVYGIQDRFYDCFDSFTNELECKIENHIVDVLLISVNEIRIEVVNKIPTGFKNESNS